MPDIKRLAAVISNNKDTLTRKGVVAIGSALGMLIASSLIDVLTKPTIEVVYIEVPVEHSSSDSAIQE